MKIHEQIFQVNNNGLTIRGIEYRPIGDNLPAVIICHGFLATYSTAKHYACYLANKGFAAYCFDFIGGGIGCHSDGKLRDMTVLTEKSDLHVVIDYVLSLSYIKSDDLTLMGCSQGGFVSAMVASESSNAVSRLILLYPAFCIPDDARNGQMLFFKFDPKNIPDKIGISPLTLSGDYARAVLNMNPYKEINNYKGPVLLIHGEKDKIVDLSYAYDAKETYGDSCKLHVLPKAGHGFNKRDDQLVFPMIDSFLLNEFGYPK